jgi:hypothetical protein
MRAAPVEAFVNETRPCTSVESIVKNLRPGEAMGEE